MHGYLLGPCLSPARRDYGFTVSGNPNDRLVLPGAEALPEINAESLLQSLGLEGMDWGCLAFIHPFITEHSGETLWE